MLMNVWMPEAIGNPMLPMPHNTSLKWDSVSQGGDLNAVQVNQMEISGPSGRRACFATLLVAGVAGSAYGADYTPVTDARLANPEPENWLMTRGNYKGWSYSALDQINAYNVKNCAGRNSRPEWIRPRVAARR